MPTGAARREQRPAEALPALLSEPRGGPGQLRAPSACLWPRKCLETYFPLTGKSCGGAAGRRETTGVGLERRLLGEDCPDRGGAAGGTAVPLKAAMAAALPSAPRCQHSRWRCPPPLPAPKMPPQNSALTHHGRRRPGRWLRRFRFLPAAKMAAAVGTRRAASGR